MRVGCADERAAVRVEEFAIHRGDLRVGETRPLRGLGGGASEPAREVREDVALDCEEGREVGRLDGRQAQERGAVVPSGIVAVVVFAKAVAVAVAAGQPPAGPARERAVGFGETLVAEVVRRHHAVQRPAVDGRFHEAAQDRAFAHVVRQRTVLRLQVEHRQERIPRQVRVAGRERDRVEAVVPAPDAVHPVFRHQQRVASEEPGLRDRKAPEQVRRRGARFRELRRRFGDTREKRFEVRGPRGAGGVEGSGRNLAVPFGGALAQGELQRTGGGAPRTPCRRQQIRGHREGVAAVPAGIVGHEAAGARGEEELGAVLVRVGQEERAVGRGGAGHGNGEEHVEAAVLREEVEPQTEAGPVGPREDRGGVREDELPRARGAFGAERFGALRVAFERERGAVGPERDQVRDERRIAARAQRAQEQPGWMLPPPVVFAVGAQREVGARSAERDEGRIDVHGGVENFGSFHGKRF